MASSQEIWLRTGCLPKLQCGAVSRPWSRGRGAHPRAVLKVFSDPESSRAGDPAPRMSLTAVPQALHRCCSNWRDAGTLASSQLGSGRQASHLEFAVHDGAVLRHSEMSELERSLRHTWTPAENSRPRGFLLPGPQAVALNTAICRPGSLVKTLSPVSGQAEALSSRPQPVSNGGPGCSTEEGLSSPSFWPLPEFGLGIFF